MRLITVLFFMTLVLASEEIFYIKNEKKVFLNKKDSESLTYKTSNNVELSLNDKILVKFIGLDNILEYMEDYNLSKCKEIDSSLYQFQVSDKNRLFTTVNSLSLKKDIKYAEPDFIKMSISR